MTLDQFLEHRDMTKLLKEIPIKKHSLKRVPRWQIMRNLLLQSWWRLRHGVKAWWWWCQWDTWVRIPKGSCRSGCDVAVIWYLRICKMAALHKTGEESNLAWWRKDVSNTVVAEAEALLQLVNLKKVSRRDWLYEKIHQMMKGQVVCWQWHR